MLIQLIINLIQVKSMNPGDLTQVNITYTLDSSFQAIKVTSKYIPLGLREYSYQLPNTDVRFFLASLNDQKTGNLIYLYYVELLPINNQIIHHILIQQDDIWTDYQKEFDSKNYEGRLIKQYFYYDDEKNNLIILIRDEEKQTIFEKPYIEMNSGNYNFILGGQFQFKSPVNDDQLMLQIFSGSFIYDIYDEKEAIIKEQKNSQLPQNWICSNIYNLSADGQLQVSESKDYQQFFINKQNYFYYKLSFWTIIDELNFNENYDQEINIIRICANRFLFVDFQSTGANSFVMKYKYNSINQQWKINIEYYSYDFPIIIQFENNDDPFSKKDEILIQDSQCLFNWQFIVIEYDPNQLNFKLENSQNSCHYTRKYLDVYQFSNLKYKFFFGGSYIDTNTLGLSFATISFYDCNKVNNICHYSCQTCFGPLSNQCLSCFDGSNRLYNQELHSCPCKLWYNEHHQSSCFFLSQKYQGQPFTFNLRPINELEDRKSDCNFGQFVFEQNCYECPSANQSNSVACAECLIDPFNWINNPICSQVFYKENQLSQNYLQKQLDQEQINLQFLFSYEQLIPCHGCALCKEGEEHCFQSKIQHLNKWAYIKCLNQFIFSQGQCINPLRNQKESQTCSNHCLQCQDGQCQQCDAQKNYFLTFTKNCQECKIQHCQQCFQYNSQNFLQNSVFQSDNEEMNPTDDYFIGCLLCKDNYYYSFKTGECIKKNPEIDCLYYDNYEGIQQCFSTKSISTQLQQIEDCSQYIQNCNICIHKKNHILACIKCKLGFYINIQNGSCKNCNNQDDQTILECFSDSLIGDYYKLDYIGVYQILTQKIYDINILYQQLQIFKIQQCEENYSIDNTQGFCLIKCQYCDNCQLIENLYQCVQCSGQDDLGNIYYSQINGICYKCPSYCQFCYPMSLEQITNYNPYYNYDASNPPLRCLKNYDDSQTYIDFESGQMFPLEQSTKNRSYFQIETKFIDASTNLEDMKFSPELKFSFPDVYHDFDTTSYPILSSLSSLKQIEIFQYTHKSYYIWLGQTKFYFKNVSKIICDNCGIFPFQKYAFSIQADYGTKIFLSNIISNQDSIDNFTMYFVNKLSELKVENFTNNKSFFKAFTFLKVETFYQNSTIIIKNINFFNSTFISSSFLSFSSKFTHSILIEEVKFIDCIFQNYSFMSFTSSISQYMKITNLTIINCTLEAQTLFQFSLRNSQFLFQNIQIKNSSFKNSQLISSSGLFSFTNIFLDSVFLQNSLLFQCYFNEQKNDNKVQKLFCNKLDMYSSTLIKFAPAQTANDSGINFNEIVLSNIFLTDSYLFQVEETKLVLKNVDIVNNWIFQFLRAKNCQSIIVNEYQLQSDANQTEEPINNNSDPMLIIENAQTILFEKVHIKNQYNFKKQLFFITSSIQAQVNLSLIDISFEQIISISQSSSQNYLIYIYLISASIIRLRDLKLNSIQFNYEISKNEQLAEAMIMVQSQNSQIYFENLEILNVSTNNSQQPLLKLEADLVIFNKLLVKNINTNKNITVNSVSGFAMMSAQILRILNSQFQNIKSAHYGFIHIQTKYQGLIQIINSVFDNIQTQNLPLRSLPVFGGVLTIDAQFSELNLTILLVHVYQFSVQKTSGFIYLLPSYETNKINIQYLTLNNVYQYDSSFISFNFPQNSRKNIVVLRNIYYQNVYNQILESFSQESSFQKFKGLGIQMFNTNLTIFNFSVLGFLNEPIFSITNCSSIKLKLLQLYDITITSQIQNIISINQSSLNLQNLLINNISTEFQVQSILSLNDFRGRLEIENSLIKNTVCLQCSQGLVSLNLIIQAKILNFIFYQNICGGNACLIIYDSDITFVKSQFKSNQGRELGVFAASGSNITLIQSNFKNNIVTGLSGGIYSNKSIFSINQSYIINNSALYAGGLYQNKEKLLNSSMKQLYFQENNSTLGVKNIWELPDFLSLSMYDVIIKTEREIYGNTIIDQPNYLINSKQQRINQTFFKVPSGQQLNGFKIFDKATMKYTDANLSLQFVPFTQLGERVMDYSLQYCQISQTLVDENKNYSIIEILNLKQQQDSTQISFDQQSLSIQLGGLIYHLDPYNKNSRYIQTSTHCNFMENNYYFIFKVKSLKCQFGEYYNNEECLKCDYEKGFYSVEVNSTSCQKMDPERIKSISPSAIELQQGYWRLSYYKNSIEKCKNYEVCLGGEQVSFNSCKLGYLGAICGACDLYNIRSESQYIKNLNNLCEKKEENLGLIFLLLVESIGLLTVAFIISNLKYQMYQFYKKLKQQSIHFKILYKLQQDQQNTILKSFINFAQILYPTLPQNFQLFNISHILWSFGYPSKLVEYFVQYSSDQFRIEIIYLELLGAILLPFIQTCVYAFALVSFKRIFFQKQIYLFFVKISFTFFLVYQLPFIIQKLSLLISSRNLANIDWVETNLSYQFYSERHIKWLIFFIFPCLILFLILLPLIYLYKLKIQKDKLRYYSASVIYAYFCSDYGRDNFFWEILQLQLKLSVVLIHSYFMDNYEISKKGLIMILLFIFYLFLTKIKPHLNLNCYRIEKNVIFTICICICMTAVLVISNNKTSNLLCELILDVLIFYIILLHIYHLLQSQVNEYNFNNLKRKISQLFPQLENNFPCIKQLLRIKIRNKQQIIQRFQYLKYQLYQQKLLTAKSLRSSFNFLNDEQSGFIVSNIQRSGIRGQLLMSPQDKSIRM